MPAPAVIPAPIAYIKVVAVKKLVVGLKGSDHGQALPFKGGLSCGLFNICSDLALLALTGWRGGSEPFTLKKLGCSKQATLCLE